LRLESHNPRDPHRCGGPVHGAWLEAEPEAHPARFPNIRRIVAVRDRAVLHAPSDADQEVQLHHHMPVRLRKPIRVTAIHTTHHPREDPLVILVSADSGRLDRGIIRNWRVIRSIVLEIVLSLIGLNRIDFVVRLLPVLKAP
jgi:hypothetical protein